MKIYVVYGYYIDDEDNLKDLSFIEVFQDEDKAFERFKKAVIRVGSRVFDDYSKEELFIDQTEESELCEDEYTFFVGYERKPGYAHWSMIGSRGYNDSLMDSNESIGPFVFLKELKIK